MSFVYPKILIVGQYFNKTSGGGITMANLFEGWNKESIAATAENIHNPNFEICNTYYQLGSQEFKRRFPFNLNRWGKKIKSGQLVQEKENNSVSSNQVKKSKLKDLYVSFLEFTGLSHYKRRYRISKELLNWIKEYSPDVIYSQLSNIELISLVSELHKKLQIPIAIHIMDDWPLTISKQGISQSYWHNVIDKKFRNLLSNASVLMSISEAMSKEYQSRYGYDFSYFHNPIDIKFWGSASKKSYDANEPFIILYAGRIGLGIRDAFFDIVQAIKNLTAKGLKIKLHIQSTNSSPLLAELAKYDFVQLNKAVPYNELPQVFAKSDLLIMPNDFDNKSISFLRFSMPTKASEYMASGTPILVYSSIETAVALHALKYNWAYVVSEKNITKLENAINEIYKNKDLRIKLGSTAKEFAISHYDSGLVRDQFRKSFTLTQ